MHASTGSARDNFQSKEVEITEYWLKYDKSPTELATEIVSSLEDYKKLMADNYAFADPEWIAQQVKVATIPMLTAIEEDCKMIRASHYTCVGGWRRVLGQNCPVADFYDKCNAFTETLKKAEKAVADGKAAKSSGVKLPARIDDSSQSGSDTETGAKSFTEVINNRVKKGKKVSKKVKGQTMPLKAFRELPAEVDLSSDKELDKVSADASHVFSLQQLSPQYYRTHAVMANVLKGTDKVVPYTDLKKYKPEQIERKMTHAPEYIKIADCCPGILKAVLESKYIPIQVYEDALKKGQFTDEFNAVGKSMTFEQVEAIAPGQGEIADVIFWQARAEADLDDYDLRNKIPFVQKWFPRLLQVPAQLTCGSGEAARHFAEWIRADCRKPPKDRNKAINHTFNGFLMGMLAKWPEGWTRDRLLEKCSGANKALWGADLSAIYIAEFKKTEGGQRLVRDKVPNTVKRLQKKADSLRVAAGTAFNEAVQATGEKVAAQKAKAKQLYDEYVRMDQAATWREQMYQWRGRFTRSLPDFTRAAPKPLRIMVNAATKKQTVAEQSRWATTRSWLAATIGFPFMVQRSIARPSSVDDISVVDSKYVMRPWMSTVASWVFPTEKVGDVTVVEEPIPSMIGTAQAISETVKYALWDLPVALFNRAGLIWHNEQDEYEPVAPWPEAPPIGRALRGWGFMAAVGLASAVMVAPTLAVAQAVTAIGGVAGMAFRDAVSWIRGTDYDTKKNVWVHKFENPQEDEVVVLFDSEAPQATTTTPSDGFETISLEDKRGEASASPKSAESG